MADPAQDLLFAPPTEQWQHLSPRYRLLRRVGVLLTWLPLTLVAAGAGFMLNDAWYCWLPTLVVGLVVTGVRFWRMDALWRSWGYAELADDLYVTHGLWWRRLTAVPYGRMQVVEIEAGPVQRLLGISTVKLVTASASSDATIPGLPPAEASRLRDRLTELGETRSSGL